MSGRPHKKPPQQAVSVDDIDIDFSGVTTVEVEAETTKQLAALVAAAAAQEEKQRQAAPVEVRAMDPGLAAYVSRGAESSVGRRRKRMFGAATPTEGARTQPAPSLAETRPAEDRPASSDGLAPTAPALMDTSTHLQTASAEVMAAFLSETTTALPPGSLRARQAAYHAALHAFCTREASAAALAYAPAKQATGTATVANEDEPTVGHSGFPLCASQTNSLLDAFLDQGVPDMEPWDQWAYAAPRYDAKAITVHAHNPKSISQAKMDLVPHPVLPASLYLARYAQAAKAPVPMKLMKSKEELRAERMEHLKQKQLRLRQERENKKKEGVAPGLLAGADASTSSSSGPAAAGQGHDRLSFRHMAYNLFDESVLNPLGVDSTVLAGYEERFLAHQQLNHARHVEALPNQIAKRERDARRHAEENPSLCAYRVHPIYSPQHLGMLRNFANDNRLRGFVLWVGQCDALLVLSGGRVAMRHLDRWILHKTDWESPETRAVRLCTVPLPHWQAFSFHNEKKLAPEKKKARIEETEIDPRKQPDDDREHVFISHAQTVEDGEHFLRTVVPAGGTPWLDLCALWRSAFLGDGLADMPAE